MVKHRMNEQEWWCLPGGGTIEGEKPEQAAIRELKEECCVEGSIIAEVSHTKHPSDSESYTYLIDIEKQEPQLGVDPEFDVPILVDIAWLSLKEIPERDRAFLWFSGLLAIPEFYAEVAEWGDDRSYPKNPEK
jgi:ADP-ribose pyrophosphatase YjhB (NUDIX family)